MEVLKVSAKSIRIRGRSIGGCSKRARRSEIQAGWCRSIESSSKGRSHRKRIFCPSGVDLICIPAFTDIEIDGQERTAMKLIVEPR